MTATGRVAVAIWGVVVLCIAGMFGMTGLHLRVERTEAYRRMENDAARIVRGAEAGINRSLLGVDLLLAGAATRWNWKVCPSAASAACCQACARW